MKATFRVIYIDWVEAMCCPNSRNSDRGEDKINKEDEGLRDLMGKRGEKERLLIRWD